MFCLILSVALHCDLSFFSPMASWWPVSGAPSRRHLWSGLSFLAWFKCATNSGSREKILVRQLENLIRASYSTFKQGLHIPSVELSTECPILYLGVWAWHWTYSEIINELVVLCNENRLSYSFDDTIIWSKFTQNTVVVLGVMWTF